MLADEAPGVEVVSAQKVGGTSGEFYEMRTGQLSAEQANAAKTAMAQEFGIPADQISGSEIPATTKVRREVVLPAAPASLL